MAPGTLRPLTVKAARVAAVTYAGPLFLLGLRWRPPLRRGGTGGDRLVVGGRDRATITKRSPCGPTHPVFRRCSTTQRHAHPTRRPRATPRHGPFVRLRRPKTCPMSGSSVTCVTRRATRVTNRSRPGADRAGPDTGHPGRPAGPVGVDRGDPGGHGGAAVVELGQRLDDLADRPAVDRQRHVADAADEDVAGVQVGVVHPR